MENDGKCLSNLHDPDQGKEETIGNLSQISMSILSLSNHPAFRFGKLCVPSRRPVAPGRMRMSCGSRAAQRNKSEKKNKHHKYTIKTSKHLAIRKFSTWDLSNTLSVGYKIAGHLLSHEWLSWHRIG